MKAFASKNIKVTQKLKFNMELVENIVGKRGNASQQHFILFLQCFHDLSFSGLLHYRIVLLPKVIKRNPTEPKFQLSNF